MKYSTKYIAATLLVISLWSCKVQKVSIENKITTPEIFRGGEEYDPGTSIGKLTWEEFFKDEQLQKLISKAIENNVDMVVALKNIEISRLYLKQAKTGYQPKLMLNAKASTSNPSDYSFTGMSLEQFLGTKHQEDYMLYGTLSWEADIWGKIKNRKAAALSDYLSQEETKKAVQTQIISDVAKGYYSLVLLNQLKVIAEQNLALSEKTMKTVKNQYEVGDATLLAYEQSAAQKLTAEALIPEYVKNIKLQENAIQVLCGNFPDVVTTNELSSYEDIFTDSLTVGIPAELLSLRPDVKQAELMVRKAFHTSKASRASMYPSFSISAEGGIGALKASNWFNLPGSVLTVLTAGITQPVLNHRQLKTQYEVSVLEQEKLEAQFKQIVINAVGEVSDAMITIKEISNKEKTVMEKNNRLKNAVKNAHYIFDAGEATYLEVISAENNLLNSDIELAQLKNDKLNAVIQLYRSLGGGWKN
ncbi:RND transporter [Empedobacter brevis]|uniref:TolC family protein n=1 Tax=Empedobacter brevis TaxID=247 RepID=UPI00131FA1E0|nr:TolC family protein [Empedobacter brevis]QHC86027.1 RND transporter [Empedobacter brevis]